MTIPLFRPVVDTEAALANLRQVFDSGWLGLGPLTERFESEFGKLVGARHTVATNSGTSALQLAVRSLDLLPGSRVLTTPITFVSTNAVLLYERLIPVFCDVEPRTGNISVESIKEGIRRFAPAAIMIVHLGGYPCDLDAVNQIALSRGGGVSVIEDCSHAAGARYKGKPVGSGSNLCCWSFHAVKPLATGGDGGAVTTQDPDLASRLRRLRWLGIDKSTSERTGEGGGYSPCYDIRELGLKAHMNDIMAAIGLAQLPHLEEQSRRRTDIAARYWYGLKDARPDYYDTPERRSAHHFLPLFFDNRDAVRSAFTRAGIQTGMHYRRNNLYAPFRDCPVVGDTGARWYEEHELTLPLHVALTDVEVDKIISTVNAACV